MPRSVSPDSRVPKSAPAPEFEPAAPKGWMQSVKDSVKGCIGDLCNRTSKTKPPPSLDLLHAVGVPVRRSTMESSSSPEYMTSHKAAEQTRAENAAQKELEKEQARLNEARTNLTEEQGILDAKKIECNENLKNLEDEISRLDELASENFKSNGGTHFGVQPCGKCNGKHQTRNCDFFTKKKKIMQAQQKAFEDRQAELDAQHKSLEDQQSSLNTRHGSMIRWLPDPWSPRLYQDKQHAEGGAKTKRRHSKTKRSKSKSKKGKKSHRRHH